MLSQDYPFWRILAPLTFMLSQDYPFWRILAPWMFISAASFTTPCKPLQFNEKIEKHGRKLLIMRWSLPLGAAQ
ncbi:MAG: hypothetical protein E7H57_07500 [Pantoea sp.]|nr:hypothetical protein [Pantoea sp.]